MVQISIGITKDTVTPLLEDIINQLRSAGTVHLRLGATAPYSVFVEFGTRKMAAQPFLRPAANAYFSQVVEALANGAANEDIRAGWEEAGANMQMMALSICPTRTGYLRSTIFHSVW